MMKVSFLWNRKKISPLQMNRAEKVFHYLVLLLPLAQFAIFYVAVNLNTVLLSFKQYLPDGSFNIVWFENIGRVLQDFVKEPRLYYGLKNSLLYFVCFLVFGVTLSLFFSYYIFKKFPFANTFKIFLFLPQVISSIIMVLIYRFAVSNLIPTLMNKLFGMEMQGLLDNGNTVLGAVIFYNLWVGFGSNILLYVGAMNNVSESCLEAAKIDGAGFFREFFFIVFPQIFATFTTLILMALASIFTWQLELYSFWGKGAEVEMYTVGYYMYIETLSSSMVNKPYLAAMGLTITLVIAPISLLVKWAMEKFGPSVN